ncbi:MAG: carboxypeptidase-like regulatory domain-containing protein [Bacteroidales bacterium]|jgi:hypothetical protein|nr:carboxypeptidase-like regulatory domain-containing protein [Bacteroidales bacterium]
MKTKVMYLFFLSVFCSFLLTNAQEKGILIKGRVSDEFGPMPGVVVQIKETSDYVLTGYDGSFSIRIPSENTVLVFSMAGMVTQEVAVDKQVFINISMKDDGKY